MSKDKIDVSFKECDDDLISVTKDGKELVTFNRDQNIGDICQGVVCLLEALGFEVKSD